MSSETPTRLTDDHVQALASLDPETIRAIGEAVDDAGGSGGMSRRQMLGVLAGLGGAGLATGYASREVTAQPDGSPGVIGQQNDRTDVWGDQIDTSGGAINEVYTAPAPSQSSDIGAEINDIHDNKAVDYDGIFVPPGIYENQNTTITITKNVQLFSVGNFLTCGASIYKQSDIPQVDMDAPNVDEMPDAARKGGISGIKFDGRDVSGSSVGLAIDGISYLSVQSDRQPGHAVHMLSDDGSANSARIEVLAQDGDADGLRIENSGGGINMNAMWIKVHAVSQGGTGFYQRDAYGNRIWLWAQSCNKPYDIVDASNGNHLTVYSESASVDGTYPASSPYSQVDVLNHTGNMTLPLQQFDEYVEVPEGDVFGYRSGVVSDSNGASEQHRSVHNVSTTSTEITYTGQGCFAMVIGQDTSSSSTVFADFVSAFSNGGHMVHFSDSQGTPDPRTYSMNGNRLELAMDSGTYDVSVLRFGRS